MKFSKVHEQTHTFSLYGFLQHVKQEYTVVLIQTFRPSAHMQFFVEWLLADSCPRRRETLRLMGVRTHHDSSNSRRAVVLNIAFNGSAHTSR
jgi:hypothetical protein